MSIEGKKIFITGGAGFIGSELIGQLIEKNQVTVYDTFRRDSIRHKPYARHKNLSLVHGDVCDKDALSESMRGSNIVIHAAAVAGIDTVIVSPVTTMRVNIVGSSNVLECAKELKKCERVILFSTSEVFGTQAYRSAEDSYTHAGPVGEARWTYAVSKLAGEHMNYAYFKEFGLPTVTVRPFNIYGPGQIGEGAIRTFVLRAIQNLPIEIHGDGTQIRAWCYITDMVDALMLMMQDQRAVGESFNIGNQRAVITIYGLANLIVRLTKSRSTISFVRKDYADIEIRVPSVSKSRDLLGFEAKVDMDEGIMQTAQYCRKLLRKDSSLCRTALD